MADLDGDGRLDVISGSYWGPIYVFRRKADGSFARGRTLKRKDGRRLKVGRGVEAYATAVAVADWDADGDPDLVVGNIEGKVFLVRNEGTSKKHAFGKAEQLETAGEPIAVPGDAGPTVADWDGDGRLDLLVGAGDGSVVWFRNEGPAKEPVLAAPRTLVPRNARRAAALAWLEGVDPPPESERPWGGRVKPSVADWNGDGLPDLLVGDYLATTGPPPEPSEEERPAIEEARKKGEALRRENREAERRANFPRLFRLRNDLLDRPTDESPEGKRDREEKFAEVRRQIAEVAEALRPLRERLAAVEARIPQGEDVTHGFVWLFLRKPPAAVAETR